MLVVEVVWLGSVCCHAVVSQEEGLDADDSNSVHCVPGWVTFQTIFPPFSLAGQREVQRGASIIKIK